MEGPEVGGRWVVEGAWGKGLGQMGWGGYFMMWTFSGVLIMIPTWAAVTLPFHTYRVPFHTYRCSCTPIPQ